MKVSQVTLAQLIRKIDGLLAIAPAAAVPTAWQREYTDAMSTAATWMTTMPDYSHLDRPGCYATLVACFPQLS